MLSVIIPTCNRNDLLSKCLDLLAPSRQTISYNEYEVIVTDDSKENIAKKLIEDNYGWVTWIEGPKRGPAANRNHGAKQAKAKWLIFIDDDVLPGEMILENYKKAIEMFPDNLAFEGTIVPDDWNLMKKEMAECPINTKGNCFWSANVCIQNTLFFNIDGFDEGFKMPALEDEDLYTRLKSKTNVKFLDTCVVVHPVRYFSLQKKIRGMKLQFENWMYYIDKHDRGSQKRRLSKAVMDYLYMSLKDLKDLKFRLMFLHTLNSFYCLYLLVSYRNDL